MKRIICILLTAVLILGLCACGESGKSASKKGFQVGFNRQSITPTTNGVPIAGGDSSARPSEGFLDEVATTCIAFSKDGETYLIYTCDFMILNASVTDPVKATIEAATGVPASNILFNCTHTHSGVDINSSKWDGVSAYRQLFSTRALKAAEKALEDLSPATISYGSTQTEGMTFVRHYLMNDGTFSGNGHGSSASGYKDHMYEADGELQIIKFTRAAEDKKDIIIASFPAHATTVNSTNRTSLSACYPGAFRAAVERDAGVHCAFFQGASGDQVPNSKIEEKNAINPKNHKNHGEKLAEYALSVELTPMEDSKLVFKSWEYTGPSMKEGLDDAELMAHASEIASLSNKLGSSHIDVQALVSKYGFLTVYEATGLVSRSKAPETRTMRLVAMQLGSEVSMAFAPYEMFGMHGKYIKDNSPFAMDFIVTCTEDYQGYFPHVEGCEEGFYEYDVTKYERGTGEKLAELFASTLTEMKNAG